MDENSLELTPVQMEQIKTAFEGAFNKAFESVNRSAVEGRAMEGHNNNRGNKVQVQQGVQDLLTQLLVQLAKQLGLGPNDVEMVFKGVIKLIDEYKNKEAEN